MGTNSYNLGHTAGKHAATITLLIAAVGLAGYMLSNDEAPAPKSKAPTAETSAQRCARERPAQLETYRKEMAAGLPWQAANAVRACAGLASDADLARLTEEAEHADRVKTANNPNTSITDRLSAVEKLLETDNSAQLEKLRTDLTRKQQKIDADRAKADAAQRKKEGVRIGMTPDDVRASSWGKPERINRHTNAYGVTEQWVYPGGSYIYFRNGLIEGISN